MHDLSTLPADRKGELSRLVVIPWNRGQSDLPRHLVMLFLIHMLARYFKENRMRGGYAFIKSKLGEKLCKTKMPVHRIDSCSVRYRNDGVLHHYFNRPNDPVLPISYDANEINDHVIAQIKRFTTRRSEEEFEVDRIFYTGCEAPSEPSTRVLPTCGKPLLRELTKKSKITRIVIDIVEIIPIMMSRSVRNSLFLHTFSAGNTRPHGENHAEEDLIGDCLGWSPRISAVFMQLALRRQHHVHLHE